MWPGRGHHRQHHNVYMGGLAGGGDLGLTNTGGDGVGLVVGGNNSSTTYTGQLSGTPAGR